jgi:hypothetical protein
MEAFGPDVRAPCSGYASDPMESLARRMSRIEEQLFHVAGVTDEVTDLNAEWYRRMSEVVLRGMIRLGNVCGRRAPEPLMRVQPCVCCQSSRPHNRMACLRPGLDAALNREQAGEHVQEEW